jgi:hypothetical protein
MAAERRLPITPRLIIGLSVILLGLVFLLDEMGRLEADRVLRYWPLLLIALGVAWLLQPRGRGGGQIAGGIVTLAGVWFLADNLGWVRSNPLVLLRYFWPVLLLTAGASLVWRSLRGPRPALDGVRSNDRLGALALLSGIELSNASQAFAGGYATAIMGGCEIDLSQARVAGEEAVIDVFALWGGVEIKVPADWEVVGKVTPLLGGFESKAAQPTAGGQRLVVTGSAIMGGVEVHN